MERSMVDVKADESQDESTAGFTRYWTEEPHRSMIRIKQISQETITIHL